MTSPQKQARLARLEKLAKDAIQKYNDETAKGAEPLLPDWALELLALLDDHDRLVALLAQQKLQPVHCVDFETGTTSTSVVQRQDKIIAAMHREESPTIQAQLAAQLKDAQ